MPKKKKSESEGADDRSVVLTLECAACGWEWTDYCQTPGVTIRCPKCFHERVYLIRVM